MEEGYETALIERRHEIYQRIASAAAASGRSAEDISVIAVSKTVGPPEVLAAIRAGYTIFGENRPQMLLAKLTALAEAGVEPVRFDLIGNLQKNKINTVIGRVALIHSISSLHLAEAVSSRVMRRAEAEAQSGAGAGNAAAVQSGAPARVGAAAGETPHEGVHPQDVLLEVNISGEPTKAGFAPAEVLQALPELAKLPGICIRGLMTMAPQGDRVRARATFEGLRELRDTLATREPDLDLSELSCGMSEDFEEAIAAGSTMVRLGRVVFDPAFALR